MELEDTVCFLVLEWTCLPVTDHYIVYILNQISCSYFINFDKLTSDKPVVFKPPRKGDESCLREPQMRALGRRVIVWGLAPRLRRESLPLMENYCLPLRTYNCVEYGSAYLDLCTRQWEGLYPTESYFGIVISTQVDSD